MATTTTTDTASTQLSKVKTYVPEYKQPKVYKTEMGKDEFLNLLVTQLKNQNPLEPMKDQEFIAQMAQFSSLEQAQNTNKSIREQSATNMVGKAVIASVKNAMTGESADIAGMVASMEIKSGEVLLNLTTKTGTTQVKFDEITQVTDPKTLSTQLSYVDFNTQMSSAGSLIGKNITALVSRTTNTGRGNVTTQETVEGVVDSFKIAKGVVTLIVGGKEVKMDEVQEVKGSTI